MLVAKRLFLEKSEKTKILYELYQELKPMDFADLEILKIINIAINIPVTTASNEQLFSVLRMVKTNLIKTKWRITMGNKRLSGLLLMRSEKKLLDD